MTYMCTELQIYAALEMNCNTVHAYGSVTIWDDLNTFSLKRGDGGDPIFIPRFETEHAAGRPLRRCKKAVRFLSAGRGRPKE